VAPARGVLPEADDALSDLARWLDDHLRCRPRRTPARPLTGADRERRSGRNRAEAALVLQAANS
jgi:hypothetical protein